MEDDSDYSNSTIARLDFSIYVYLYIDNFLSIFYNYFDLAYNFNTLPKTKP